MASQETLQLWLDRLQAARASGVLTVEYGDRRVTYRNDAELAAAIADVSRQLRGPQQVHTVLFQTSKGLT
jgi:hypothetical protein